MQLRKMQLRLVPARRQLYDMTLTVCLLNWKRPTNLRRILDRLAEQTLRAEMAIFLWNNASEPFYHPAVDWQVDSGRNVRCPPRWWMAAQAETEFAASLDDDLLPADPRVLEDAVRVARRQPADRAIGPFGVIFRQGRPYAQHLDARCPPQDTPVDMVQGRCLMVRTAALRSVLKLGDFCGDAGGEDDITVCGALAAGRRKHHLVPGIFPGRFEELPAGHEALERRPDHARRREAARQRWFPEETR